MCVVVSLSLLLLGSVSLLSITEAVDGDDLGVNGRRVCKAAVACVLFK